MPFFDGGEEVEFRPNIGVAVSSPERYRAVDLLRDANIARAWARVQGSGQWVMFDPSMKAPEGDQSTDEFDVKQITGQQPGTVGTTSPASDPNIDQRLTDLQDRIRRHDPVRDNPSVRSFTLQIFGHKNDVLVLDPDVENLGNVDVIEFLGRARLLLKLFACCLVNASQRNDLQGYGMTGAVIDRLVGDHRTQPRELARGSIFLNTDAVMLGESC